MLLLDDNTNALIVAQATQNTPPAPAGPLGEKLLAIDSTTSAVKDSLSNLTSLSDLKEVVTGENTIVKDALSALVKLSVEFVPKLLVAIVILWVGMKLVKMLRRVIQKSLDKRGAESSLKTRWSMCCSRP